MNIAHYLFALHWIPLGLGVRLGDSAALRMIKRKALLTEKDSLTLCGHTRAEVFSSRLLLRFFRLLLVVIAVRLAVGQWIAPLGAGWVLAALAPVGLR
jgi:hypothetical protein